jgi:hypothetical protein
MPERCPAQGKEPHGCRHGLPPPDRCSCAVILFLSGVAAGLLALGFTGGEQEPQPIVCTVNAVVVGGCRYECNCRTVCGVLQTPCGAPSRSDTRRRRKVCDNCPGHKYLYVAQTLDCATQGYGAFTALLGQRASAMQVTGGTEALAGIEPGLVDYRQPEDPTSWTCISAPVHSVGDSVAGCQMLSCDDGEFCSDGGACPAKDTGASAFGLILGGILALALLVQVACMAKWQLLRVCGRLPPEVLEAAAAAESVVVAVQPKPPEYPKAAGP